MNEFSGYRPQYVDQKHIFINIENWTPRNKSLTPKNNFIALFLNRFKTQGLLSPDNICLLSPNILPWCVNDVIQ